MPPVSSALVSLALVVAVIDGDTIRVQHTDGRAETVRLIGIDTPELRPAECYGAQAKQAAREYMLRKHVMLEADRTQADADRYGRKLRYVWLGNDLINERLLMNGFAVEYTYKRPYVYKQRFEAAEQTAKAFGNGLWVQCE